VPYDAGSSFMRGAADGPAAIREAFHSDASNYWSESGIDLGARGAIVDAGDVSLWGEPDVRAAIERSIEGVLEQGGSPLSLGGDHSITYPIVRALKRRMHPHLAVLHIDAHPDLYPEFQGDRYSHACPMARILEEGLVERMVQVGIRTMTGVQREQVDRFGVEIVAMRTLSLAEELSFDVPLYISLDLDALDPAFAPGVSHREPGGLSVRQIIDIIQRVRARIAGADIVELNPRMDTDGITATGAAKLLKELAAKMIASPA
jgi:agmatinase